MNFIRTLLTLLIIGLLSQNVQAQFLKKLKKKVEDRVEETLINKTAEKASEEASKSLEKVFDPNFGGNLGQRVTPENVPERFSFDYKYQLKMTTSEGDIKMDYFLKPDASYLGISMNVGQQMFMVIDGEQNISYMFLDSKDSKICTATSLDMTEGLDDELNDLNTYTITKLPNKTFLGYDCPGIQMENDDYVFIMYYTNEAPVSFNDVFQKDPDRIPLALRSHFKDNENSLMLYMDMKDKKNKRRKNTSGTMECTLLEPSSFDIVTAEYKLM